MLDGETVSLLLTSRIRYGRSPLLENGHASSTEAGLTNGLAHTNGHAHPDEVHIKLEEASRPKKKDHTVFGLALYALSSCFLATMLVFAKRLGEGLSGCFQGVRNYNVLCGCR